MKEIWVGINKNKIIKIMSDFEKYKQFHTVELKKISELPEISIDKVSFQVSKEKSKSFCKRMNDLEGNLKLIQKQYKENLKEGFENKIKAFRLQAVIERKMLKETIETAKKNLDNDELREKIKKTESIRNRQIQAMKSISARRQEKRNKVRSKMQREKKEWSEKKKEQISTIQQMNKQSHNKVCKDFRNRHLKKVYMEGLRRDKMKKEEQMQKKDYVQKIINNKDTLQKLKEELSQMSSQNTKDLFITI